MGINLKVTGKNIDVTEGLRDAIAKKANKLEKYISDRSEIAVNVVLKVEKERQTAEVSVPIKKTVVRTEQTTDDMYASIDLAFDVIEKQIRKYKDKIITRKQSGDVFKESFLAEESLPLDEIIIKKRKSIELDEMTAEDACVEMDLVEHDFYAFKNVETGNVNLVYKRNDGSNGLIEIR